MKCNQETQCPLKLRLYGGVSKKQSCWRQKHADNQILSFPPLKEFSCHVVPRQISRLKATRKKVFPWILFVEHCALVIYVPSPCLTHSVNACCDHDRSGCVGRRHCCRKHLGRRPSKFRGKIAQTRGRAVVAAHRRVSGLECWFKSSKNGRGNPG